MDSEFKEFKEFLDYLHEVSYKVLKVPRKLVKSFEDIDSDSEMTDVDRKFSEWINNNNFFLSSIVTFIAIMVLESKINHILLRKILLSLTLILLSLCLFFIKV